MEEKKTAEEMLNPTLQETAENPLAELDNLSDEEKKTVEEVASKINITDAQQILQYGAAAQKSIADFSETALGSAKNKDLGEAGTMISSLLAELKGFDAAEEKKGLLGIFKRAGGKLELLRSRYEKSEKSVEAIAEKLEAKQITLLKDIEILEQMYAKNLDYHKMLTMYILAGRMKLKRERETTLASMQEIARRTELPQDVQAVQDMENACSRFERKLHDLELTRVVCLQMAPQIRLLQNNDAALAEKIQTSLVSTIPLWKSQMLLALGLSHSEDALKAQSAVSDMTNELLKKNSQMLRQSATSTAKEAERGIIDLETLRETNENLLATLDEVLQIQREGAEKRASAEAELRRIEGDLKQKLLEVQGTVE